MNPHQTSQLQSKESQRSVRSIERCKSAFNTNNPTYCGTTTATKCLASTKSNSNSTSSNVFNIKDISNPANPITFAPKKREHLHHHQRNYTHTLLKPKSGGVKKTSNDLAALREEGSYSYAN